MSRRDPAGFSMIGMLISVACMAVLATILMTSMDKAITGNGSTAKGSVRSVQDQMNLSSLFQVLLAHAPDQDGYFATPSWYTGDLSDNTSASFWSMLIMNQNVSPSQLVAGNEYSWLVEVDDNYDHGAYSANNGVYWDPAFRADLQDGSNVSFAHLPMCGARYDRGWRSDMVRFPILGHRGPRDGIDDPDSYSYGRNGQWGGYVVYADGHVSFTSTFTPGDVFYEVDGRRVADNIFVMEEGVGGADAMLGFTRRMTDDGPEFQWD